jgi:hypothetical protein
MRLVRRKSEPDRLLDTLSSSVGAVTGGVSGGRLVKTGLIVGGLAALTAGSAAISSIRRRLEADDQ